LSKSSNHGATKKSHSSKTDFLRKECNDTLDRLLQCNNVSISHGDPNNKTPISITRVDKEYFSPELKQALLEDEKTHNFKNVRFSSDPTVVSVNLSEPLTAWLAFVLADISL